MRKKIADTDSTIDIDGRVYDASGHVVPPFSRASGNLCVRLFNTRTYKFTRMGLARLLLQTFEPKNSSDWLSVRWKNSDTTDCRLANLEWSSEIFTPHKDTFNRCDSDRLYDIPGYEGYRINLNGTVYTPFGKRSRTKLDEKARVFIGVRGIEGYRTIQLARLMALTFLPHPYDTDHLVVNHRDGNYANNTISNLEWCTYGVNNRHAFESGLRESTHVDLKNMDTGELKTFNTLRNAAEFLNTKPNALHTYLVAKLVPKFTPYRGWMLRKSDDPAPWPDQPTKDTRVYYALDMMSGISYKTRSLSILEKMSGISSSTIRILLFSNTRPRSGWMFKALDETEEKTLTWPVYPPWVVELFNNMDRNCNPVEVVDLTSGELTRWLGIKYWCRATNQLTDPAVICRHLKQSNRWKNFRFTFIDLYETVTATTKAVNITSVPVP